MHNPRHSINELESHKLTGTEISAIVNKFFDKPTTSTQLPVGHGRAFTCMCCGDSKAVATRVCVSQTCRHQCCEDCGERDLDGDWCICCRSNDLTPRHQCVLCSHSPIPPEDNDDLVCCPCPPSGPLDHAEVCGPLELGPGRDPNHRHCCICWQFAKVPFYNCNFCGARPSYHHGRCCAAHPDNLSDNAAWQKMVALRSFVNYGSFDEDADAQAEIEKYLKANMLVAFDNYDKLCDYLGAEPVLLSFGVLGRIKDGVLKRRVTLDERQSKFTEHTKMTHRLKLPNATDAVHDILDLSEDLRGDECVECVILDVQDAFCNIPSHSAERRHSVDKSRGRWIVYLRTPQGSSGALYSVGISARYISRARTSRPTPKTSEPRSSRTLCTSLRSKM